MAKKKAPKRANKKLPAGGDGGIDLLAAVIGMTEELRDEAEYPEEKKHLQAMIDGIRAGAAGDGKPD